MNSSLVENTLLRGISPSGGLKEVMRLWIAASSFGSWFNKLGLSL